MLLMPLTILLPLMMMKASTDDASLSSGPVTAKYDEDEDDEA